MSEMQHRHLLFKVRSYQRCVRTRQDESIKNELGVAGGHCPNELCEYISCEGVVHDGTQPDLLRIQSPPISCHTKDQHICLAILLGLNDELMEVPETTPNETALENVPSVACSSFISSQKLIDG